MANKKTSYSSKASKSGYRAAAKSAAAKAVKKTAKKNPKAVLIAVLVLVLIVAIAALTLFFGFPTVWQSIFGGKISPASDGILPQGAVSFADGDLSLHFIDIGQGDAIFIIFPDGKDMLIDCGSVSASSENLGNALDYLDLYVTDGQLDYLMLTHCDKDHVVFLDEVLEKYDVDNIFMPNVKADFRDGDTESNRKLNADLADAITRNPEDIALFGDPDTIDTIVYIEFFIAALNEPDCSIKVNVDANEDTNNISITGEDYSLIFYCPTQEYYDDNNLNNAEKKNAICPVGILSYKGYRVVLTGDSNETNEPWLKQRIGGELLDCDVLKVAHHGSDSSSTEPFLDYVDCEYAVISCNAEGNNYNHPRQATLDRFIERQMTVYRTDNNGNIVLVINTKLTFLVQTRVEQSVNQTGY
jgi:competence protein ComEC